MGASFQAPHAAPGQRQMEHTMFTMKFIFQYVPATRSHWLTYIQDENNTT